MLRGYKPLEYVGGSPMYIFISCLFKTLNFKVWGILWMLSEWTLTHFYDQPSYLIPVKKKRTLIVQYFKTIFSEYLNFVWYSVKS